MASGDVSVTVIGNICSDVEMRFTPQGNAVTKFRIASTPRYFDKQAQAWKDGEPLFLQCNVWRQPGENAAESLEKGARVIVVGSLRQRTYEKDGQKRTSLELEVDEIGPSLRYATAKVQKMQRSNGSGGGTAQGGGFDDPWATSTPATSGASSGGGFQDSEPPF